MPTPDPQREERSRALGLFMDFGRPLGMQCQILMKLLSSATCHEAVTEGQIGGHITADIEQNEDLGTQESQANGVL